MDTEAIENINMMRIDTKDANDNYDRTLMGQKAQSSTNSTANQHLNNLLKAQGKNS